MSVPLYAPTPIQPAHPTPFYIEDILGRTASTTSPSSSSSSCSTPIMPTPTLPSPNSSFTSLISPYRTPIYEPTPIHPALSHHAAAAFTYASAGAFAGSIYPFHHHHHHHHQQHHRSMGDYAQALLRHDPL
ncbi:hematopoietically-expressed homeobox protein HHEX-like, partial [Notothenia coriiceps]|uniref:Hematopoietically-expressed homeobox protein HHEX-like n=1 Tax=Notothenia coriiceps TaxID=8208 RepID=A0A6I9NTI0_9TELE